MMNSNAVYGWCRFRYPTSIIRETRGTTMTWFEYVTMWTVEWVYLLLYYKGQILPIIKSQVAKLRVLFYSARFISRNGGFHWDRKC